MGWFNSPTLNLDSLTATVNGLATRIAELGSRFRTLVELVQSQGRQVGVLTRQGDELRNRVRVLEAAATDTDEDQDEDLDERCERLERELADLRTAFCGQVDGLRRRVDQEQAFLRDAMRAGDKRDGDQDRRIYALEREKAAREEQRSRDVQAAKYQPQRIVTLEPVVPGLLGNVQAVRAPWDAPVKVDAQGELEVVRKLWAAVKDADPAMAARHAKSLRARVQLVADESCGPDELKLVIDAGKATERVQKIKLA